MFRKTQQVFIIYSIIRSRNGVNKSSGDRILIDFIGNEVDRIKVIRGVQGQYFPEK